MSGRIQEGCRKAVILSHRDPRKDARQPTRFCPPLSCFVTSGEKKNRQIYIFSLPHLTHLTNSFPDSPAATVFQSLESKCSLSIVYTLGGKEDLSTQTGGFSMLVLVGQRLKQKEAKDNSFSSRSGSVKG